MKKSLVARGITGIVASLLGVAAVGCSAETGDYAETEIGSTSEALSLSSPATNLQTAVKSPAACKMVTPGGTDLLLLAGGFTGAGAATDALQLYTRAGGGAWSLPKLSSDHATTAKLSTARGQALAVPVPGDTSSCYVVGGASTFDGSALANAGNVTVEKVTVDNNLELTVTHASGGTDFAEVPRTLGALAACPTGSKILYFAGNDDSGTPLKSVFSFDTSSPTTAWVHEDLDSSVGGTQDMSDEHSDLAFAQESANFVVAFGNNALAVSRKVEALTATSNCSSWRLTTSNQVTSGDERVGPALVRNAAAGDYNLTGGLRAGTFFGNTKRFVVDFSGAAPSFTTQPTNAGTALLNSAVTYRPAYLNDVGANKGMLLGGKNSSTTTLATDGVQEVSAANTWTSTNLPNNGRTEAGVVQLADGKVYLAGGSKFVAGVETVLNTMEVVTP